MPSFQDKVAFVTGGANGIGAGLTRALLYENVRHVAFVDIAEKEGNALESELNNKFGALRAKFIKCDVANEDELSKALKQVLNKYMRLDIVINNAAILATDETAYKRMVEVNFLAPVMLTLKAIDIMGADKGNSGGTVVNISSEHALTQSPHLPVYTATKTAVLQFSNCIGMEPHYAKSDVRVISVCFGPTDTAILHRQAYEAIQRDRNTNVASYAANLQSVESAVQGVLEVIRKGESGSTWLVANDKPAEDITRRVKEGYEKLSNTIL